MALSVIQRQFLTKHHGKEEKEYGQAHRPWFCCLVLEQISRTKTYRSDNSNISCQSSNAFYKTTDKNNNINNKTFTKLIYKKKSFASYQKSSRVRVKEYESLVRSKSTLLHILSNICIP